MSGSHGANGGRAVHGGVRGAAMRITAALAAGSAAWLGVAPPAAAQCATAVQSQKTSTPDVGQHFALFGSAVSISGNTAVVTSPEFGSARGGRVYVYTRADGASPWTLEAALTPPAGGSALEQFGSSVSVWGDTLVVGARAQTGTPGAAYVYTRSAGVWTQVARRTSGTDFTFGNCVATNGSRVVVGGGDATRVYTAPGWALEDTIDGGAYDVAIWGDTIAVGRAFPGAGLGGEVKVFTLQGAMDWSIEATLRPDSVPYGQYTAGLGDGFGSSVDLVADTLLVGAPQDRNPADASTADRGAAFVFQRAGTSWSQYSRLNPVTPQAGARFGADVAFAPGFDNAAVVGADASSTGRPGAAHVFELNGGLWLERRVLSAGQGTDNFGCAVAMRREAFLIYTVLVGARSYDAPGPGGEEGAVFGHELDVGFDLVRTERVLEQSGPGARYGTAVAISGDYAVIGAPAEDSDEANAGAVHVLRRVDGAGWVWEATFRADEGESSFGFAVDVDVSGGVARVAVGTPQAGPNNTGYVDVYRNLGGGAWLREVRIQPSDIATEDHFGSSLDLMGDKLVVGSPEDNNAEGSNAGAVYVYTRAGFSWGSEVKVMPSELEAGDQFGVSVKLMTPTRMVVGAYGDNTGALANSGAAYVIDLQPIIGGQAWTVTEVLIPADVATGDNFGLSLATAGDSLVVVGSALDDTAAGVDAGSAYVFRATGPPGTTPNNWSLQTKIMAAAGGTNERFGWSLATDGATVLVGMPLDDNAGGADSGAAFVFRLSAGQWTEQFRFGAADRRLGDTLGWSVAIGSGYLLAGAPGDDNASGEDAGAAYFFDYSTVAPTIVASPQAAQTCATTPSVSFSGSAVGGPLTYRWYRGAAALSDQAGRLSGALTPTLTITDPGPADSGDYRMLATNPCGSTFTAAATLAACRADHNCQGGTDLLDIFAFLNAWFAGQASADFNRAGGVELLDIFAFLNAWFRGCP